MFSKMFHRELDRTFQMLIYCSFIFIGKWDYLINKIYISCL